MIKVLRPAIQTDLITANVFEELFQNNLKNVFELDYADLPGWFDSFAGPVDNPFDFERSSQIFANLICGYDFLCPSFKCIPVTPHLLRLRNKSNIKTRLLFISHSPGMFVMEWVLLHPLLRDGDIIIAPSESAKSSIECLCPEISRFVRVVNHPIPQLRPSQLPDSEKKRLITLSRINENKLIHRQIEAMKILNDRGYDNIVMDIAGDLNSQNSNSLSQYSLRLNAIIERLDLNKTVSLVGPIIGDKEKSDFLSGADLSINLSKTLEESFGKAVVEPLRSGIPVIATRWNGFIETVGQAGSLVELNSEMDLDPNDLADAIVKLLNKPIPSEICIDHAEQFSPEIIAEKYKEILEDALNPNNSATDHSGINESNSGLINDLGVVNIYSREELFGFHTEFFTIHRKRLVQPKMSISCFEDQLRELLLLTTKTPLEHFYAYRSFDHLYTKGQTIRTNNALLDSLLGSSLTSSQKMGLLYATGFKDADLLKECIDSFDFTHFEGNTKLYYQSEAFYQQGNIDKALEQIFLIDYNAVPDYKGIYLRQLAKISRKSKNKELIRSNLKILTTWLKKHPDGPVSGSIWFDAAVLAENIDNLGKSEIYLSRAVKLLGQLPVISKLENKIRSKRYSQLLKKEENMKNKLKDSQDILLINAPFGVYVQSIYQYSYAGKLSKKRRLQCSC